jgi:hypothetical protein
MLYANASDSETISFLYAKSNTLTNGGTVSTSRGGSLQHHVIHFTRVMIFNCGRHPTNIHERSVAWLTRMSRGEKYVCNSSQTEAIYNFMLYRCHSEGLTPLYNYCKTNNFVPQEDISPFIHGATSYSYTKQITSSSKVIFTSQILGLVGGCT